jgi:hypothetical protein
MAPPCPRVHSLWRHTSQPILFTLAVDGFGVSYSNKADIDHLLAALNAHHTTSADWYDALYCGITLSWSYATRLLSESYEIWNPDDSCFLIYF